MNRRRFLAALAAAICQPFRRLRRVNPPTRWICGWCDAPSHKPAPNELIVCRECGTVGVREVDRTFKMASVLKINWIGPTPTYWEMADAYLCDPRDGDLVRQLINSGALPLRNPRPV